MSLDRDCLPTQLTVDKLEIAKKASTQKLGTFYLNYLKNVDKFFVNVGFKLSSQIPKSSTEFSFYLLKIGTIFLEQV